MATMFTMYFNVTSSTEKTTILSSSKIQYMEQILPPPAGPPTRPTTGAGFATGRITLGEIEVCHVSTFEKIWSSTERGRNKKGVIAFYKPVDIPAGYFIVGHHCNTDSLQGWVVVVKEVNENRESDGSTSLPPLMKPVDYTLVWSSESEKDKKGENGFFWWPNAIRGYKALGFIVRNVEEKPSLEDLRCVRSDLTGVYKSGINMWNKKTGVSSTTT